MNLDVVEERKETARSKAKEKKDKQMNKELNQTIKAFCRLDPSLFLESKQRSPTKSNSRKLPSPLTSSMRVSSSKSVKRHRKQVQLPIRRVKQAKEVASNIQMSRSGRVIKPSRRIA